jgi:hypothetical protein
MNTLNTEILKLIENAQDQVVYDNWVKYGPIMHSLDYVKDLKTVNTFLRIQLGLLDCNTYSIRECLTDEPEMEDWLLGFEEVILPFIQQHPLPIWS